MKQEKKCSECEYFYSGVYSENLKNNLRSVHKNIFYDSDEARLSSKDLDQSSQNKIDKYMKQTNTKTIVLQTSLEE